MDNITKQQAVEIIKNAFELKESSERKEGKSFYNGKTKVYDDLVDLTNEVFGAR